jgi:hypothetical protein
MEYVPMVWHRRSATIAGALAAAVVLVPAALARRSDQVLPTLYVNYAMNCTFTITSDGGSRVSSIVPGTYQVFITTPQVFADVDLTGISDMTACKSFTQFSLTGPGVNLTTTLQDGDEDKELDKATFQPSSTYLAVDNNQPGVARVSFTTTASGSATDVASPTQSSTSGKGDTQSSLVGSSSKSTASTTSTAALPLRGTLLATVSQSGKLTLTYQGKSVTALKAGRYTVTASDKSAKGGFIIQKIGLGATTVTGVAFVGKRTATLEMRAGQWFFYPTFVGAKTYFIVTS